MRLITFLAGMATGAWLANTRSRTGALDFEPRTLNTSAAGRGALFGDERDEPGAALPGGDDYARERIRSLIGRTITNPQAIQVEVSGGCVTLRGQVQARDTILLMAEVQNTAGVTTVRNELDVQGSLEDVAPSPPSDKPAQRQAERATSHMS
jgi:hypothetical protein